MRKHIRVCGVEFNIEEVQGGKLRATNEKMLGFAYEGSSLRELRDKLPEALGDWDNRPKTVEVDTSGLILKAFERQPQSVGVMPKRLPPMPPSPLGPPSPLDYNTPAEYHRALADWHMRQQRAKELARQQQQYAVGPIPGVV